MELSQGKKAKILFCLEGFFPDQKAGTEVYVLNLSRFFIQKGHQVSILISRTEETPDYQFESIPVYTFTIPLKPLANELNGMIPPRGIDHFLNRIDDIKPDLVHFHSLGRAINSFHIEAVKNLGHKTVFTAHLGSNICIKGDFLKFGNDICSGEVLPATCMACRLRAEGLEKKLAKGAGWLITATININRKLLPPSFSQAHHRKAELHRLHKNTDAIIAIAPWIEKSLAANGLKEHVYLVKQGISEMFLKNDYLSKKRVRSEKLKLGFIGRMHPNKGFHLLRECLNALSTHNWTLDVATPKSADEEMYHREMKTWGLGNSRINWRENLREKEVSHLLDEIDLLILPSVSNEMAPLIILEAFAKKVPVLGSSYPAILDMVQDGITGSIFENRSSRDLREKLQIIIEKPDVLDQWKDNITIPRTFTDVGREMDEIYQAIL